MFPLLEHVGTLDGVNHMIHTLISDMFTPTISVHADHITYSSYQSFPQNHHFLYDHGHGNDVKIERFILRDLALESHITHSGYRFK